MNLNTPAILPASVALAVLPITTSEAAMAWALPSGSSDLGGTLGVGGGSAIQMTSYSDLLGYAGGSAGNPHVSGYNGGISSTISLSETANAYMEFGGTNPASPTGNWGSNFVFTLDRDLAPGENFMAAFSFDNGLMYGSIAPNPIFNSQGGLGTMPLQQATAFTYSMALAARTGAAGTPSWDTDGGPVSSDNQTIEITGTLFDGSLPNFGLYTWDSNPATNPGPGNGNTTFNLWDAGAGAPTVTPGSLLFEETPGAADGLGGGFRDFGTSSFRDLKVTWTAGDAGLAAGTQFRVSIDGAPVTPLVVPEPTRTMLVIIALAGISSVRRRR